MVDRVPRFMTADGSRPLHRKLQSCGQQQRPRMPYRVPGPTKMLIQKRRIWRPTIRKSQDEANSELPQNAGPNIQITQLSSDSFPSFDNEDGPKPEELRSAADVQMGPLEQLIASGTLTGYELPQEESKKKQIVIPSLNNRRSVPAVAQRSLRHDEQLQSVHGVSTINNYQSGENGESLQRVTSISTLFQLLQRSGSFQVEGKTYLMNINSQEIDSCLLSSGNSRGEQDSRSHLTMNQQPTHTTISPQTQMHGNSLNTTTNVAANQHNQQNNANNNTSSSSALRRQNTREGLNIQVRLSESRPLIPEVGSNMQYELSDNRSQYSDAHSALEIRPQFQPQIVGIEQQYTSQSPTVNGGHRFNRNQILKSTTQELPRLDVSSPLNKLIVNQSSNANSPRSVIDQQQIVVQGPRAQAFSFSNDKEESKINNETSVTQSNQNNQEVNVHGSRTCINIDELDKDIKSSRPSSPNIAKSVTASSTSTRKKRFTIKVNVNENFDMNKYQQNNNGNTSDNKGIFRNPTLTPKSTSIIQEAPEQVLVQEQTAQQFDRSPAFAFKSEHRTSLTSLTQQNFTPQQLQALQKDIIRKQTSQDRRMTEVVTNEGMQPIQINPKKHSSDSNFTFKKSQNHEDVSQGNAARTSGENKMQIVIDNNHHVDYQINEVQEQPEKEESNDVKTLDGPPATASALSHFLDEGYLEQFKEYETKPRIPSRYQKTENSSSSSVQNQVNARQFQKQQTQENQTTNTLDNLLSSSSKSVLNNIKFQAANQIEDFQPQMKQSVSQSPFGFEKQPTKKQMAQTLAEIVSIQQVQQKTVAQRTQNDKIDIVFLHASPIIQKDFDAIGKKEGFMVPPALNFQKEAKTIKEALKESGQKIIYQSKVATKDSFEQIINKEPRVLHISCHGIKNEVHTMRANFEDVRDEGHFLLFENSHGSGELVSAKQLRIFMQNSQHEFDVIFVAACDSKFIGQIFQRCGAKHVVCVEQGRFVLDTAAIQFTKTFYTHIFKGTDICTAFGLAKNAVKFKISGPESDLFVMLKQEDFDEFRDCYKKEDDHECYCLSQAEPGHLKCESEHILIKQIPYKLENLKFREKEMLNLLESLLLNDEQRIVSLLGLRGIGKSSLAINTLHYASERKIFTGGILFIRLKSKKSNFSMLKLIMRAILDLLDMDNEDKRKLVDQTCSQVCMIEYIIDFFNNQKEGHLKKKKYRTSGQNKKQLFLLCLDNAEEIILNDKDEFTAFLAELYIHCPNMRIIVTSYNNIGQLPNDIFPKTIFLRQFRSQSAVELFIKQSELIKNLREEDICKFLLLDENYPFRKILPSLKDKDQNFVLTEITQDIKTEINIQINGRNRLIELLACHDMFRQMGGNPTSINMIAAIYSNPMIKDNTLVDMYKRIKSEKDFIIQEHGEEEDENFEKAIPRVYKNHMSLKNSTLMSVNLLQDSFPEDMQLLYFLGCLPGGVKETQLKKMWESPSVRKSLDNLETLSFIDSGVEKYVLTCFMISYVEDTIDVPSKTNYMNIICDFYKELLYANYLKIGTCVNNTPVEIDIESSNFDSHSSPTDSNFNSSFNKQQSNNNSSFKKSFDKREKQQSLKDGLIDQARKYDLNSETKTIFEKLAYELRNIENCLNFLEEIANNHKAQRNTRINRGQEVQVAIENIDNRDEHPIIIRPLEEEDRNNFSSYLNPQKLEKVQSIISQSSNKSDECQFSPMSMSRIGHRSSLKEKGLANFNIDDIDPAELPHLNLIQQTSITNKANIPNRRTSITFPNEEVKELQSQFQQKTLSRKQEKDEALHSIEELNTNESKELGSTNKESSAQSCIEGLDSSDDEEKQSHQPIHHAEIGLNKFASDEFQFNQTLRPPVKRGTSFNSEKQDHIVKTQQLSGLRSMLQKGEGIVQDLENKSENDLHKMRRQNTTNTSQEDGLKFQKRIRLGLNERRLSNQSCSDSSSCQSAFSYGQTSQKYDQSQEPNKNAIKVCELDSSRNSKQKSKSSQRSSSKSSRKSNKFNQNDFKDFLLQQNNKYNDESSEITKEEDQFTPNNKKRRESMICMPKEPIFLTMAHMPNKSEVKKARSGSLTTNKSSLRRKRNMVTDEQLKRDLDNAEYLDLKFTLNNRRVSLPRKEKPQPRKYVLKESGTGIIQHKKQQSQSLLQTRTIWEKMSASGEFVILIVANTFLINDYEYCLKITQQDFSYVSNSAHFEGNILRYHALASIKLFEHAIAEGGGFVENFDLLKQAIDSLRNANSIYQASDDMNDSNCNYYGMALTEYTLGYVYKEFANELCDNRVAHLPKYEDYLQGDRQMCLTQALMHFQDAYKSFKEMKHLMGKYMSKFNEIETTMTNEYNEEYRQESVNNQIKLQQLLDDFKNYERDIGLQHSVYIDREQGRDISIMTEIVNRQQRTPLFPSKPEEGHDEDQINIKSGKSQQVGLNNSFKINLNKLALESGDDESFNERDSQLSQIENKLVTP